MERAESWFPTGERAGFSPCVRVSLAEDERVVFNIKGNRYRLMVAVTYGAHLVVIEFFGARAEHDGVVLTELYWPDVTAVNLVHRMRAKKETRSCLISGRSWECSIRLPFLWQSSRPRGSRCRRDPAGCGGDSIWLEKDL